MSDTMSGTGTIVTRDDLGDDDEAMWTFWTTEDKIAGVEEEKWHKKARKIVARYRAERPDNGRSRHQFNILWSNVQTLLPVLYARTPKPDVQRRWLNDDDTGRLASILLERAISYSLENGFDQVMGAVVEDRLLPGRGVPRVMYVPHYGEELPADDPDNEEFEERDAAPADVANPGDAKAPLREVVYEEALTTYVYWEDYREAPARTWREMPWIRYRAYMTRDQLVERFGAKGRKVNLDFNPKGVEQQAKDKSVVPPDIFKKAIVHEYWDKTRGRVIWLSPGTPGLILDDVEDPLKLPDFYPSPDPLLATTTTSTRIPVPDYIEYQDQAAELDLMTGRIDILTRALKVSGVYPGALKSSLQQLVDEGTENKLIPIEDWPMFTEKGGMANIIQFMPIKEVAETLIQLYAARDKTKDLLYEITGIGDIMRGATNPNETMGAQQLKSQFATRRVQPQQRAVARIARDTIRLIGAVIAEHFSPATISLITGYPELVPVPEIGPMPQQWIMGATPMQPPGMPQQAPQGQPQQGMVA